MKTLKHENTKTRDGYLSWAAEEISDFSEKNISAMYERGFVFTRLGKGAMTQTRSVRIDLSKFELSSENRRVLRKVENLKMEIVPLPHPNYDWQIHKMGFDFYTKKFGAKTFSANKIKELLTSENSNFNLLMKYSVDQNVIPSPSASLGVNSAEESLDSNFKGSPACRQAGSSSADGLGRDDNGTIGYCICYQNNELLHYAYPFYYLNADIANLGIGMMTKAIVWAKEQGKKFVCLGSAQNPAAIYKTQFSGFEWFDGEKWREDIEELKKIL